MLTFVCFCCDEVVYDWTGVLSFRLASRLCDGGLYSCYVEIHLCANWLGKVRFLSD